MEWKPLIWSKCLLTLSSALLCSACTDVVSFQVQTQSTLCAYACLWIVHRSEVGI
ncbi:hypothetical protein SEVIR_1G279032v4 [Setaria viridis]